MFLRAVKCQICDFKMVRHSPVLAKPCPKCGSRMTYATHQRGDMPVTPDPKLAGKPRPGAERSNT
jgi:hypothetical protein